MAPKIEHLLDSSCYSATYPPGAPGTEASDTNISSPSPTGSHMSQQHSFPFPDLPLYYPGSQQTLSLDERNSSGSTQFSEPMISTPFLGTNYVLPSPLPPYFPMPLTNNLGIAPTNVDPADNSKKTVLPGHYPPSFPNSPFSTPFKQRIGTSRSPHENTKITVNKLAELLEKELENSRVNGPNFIPLIFPDRNLPIPIDDSFFTKLESAQIWNKRTKKLNSKPASYSEDDVTIWLNTLASKIATCFELEVQRTWYAGNKMVPPRGSAIVRKPDIILLRKDDATKLISSQNEEKTQWAMILALAETTISSPRPQRMLDTVDGKSYIIFTSQHDRRFVPALCFIGNGTWSLTVTDRHGQLFSGEISLRGTAYVGLFLRILLSLMFGKEAHLGLDPNMIRDTQHHISHIHVDNKSYSVRRNIYTLQSLLGRGTKVWIVTNDNKNYILKDAWIQASRVENENKHLKRIQDIPDLKDKVPTFVAGEDVFINGFPDNTLWYRVGLGEDDDHRVHRRVLTSKIGTSITTFTSKAEFISAMIDIVQSTFGKCRYSLLMLIKDKLEVLKTLHNEAHILHRDISPNNIMLVRDDDAKVLHALLIDFDYASTLENNNTPDITHNVADVQVVDRFRTVSLFPFALLLVDLFS
jgi:hypothetical protein